MTHQKARDENIEQAAKKLIHIICLKRCNHNG
uniref:Uncharacterized protein n=1 Tax=Tetranychus urticae TaxID=32264 RepID=T1KHQ0_TETUR